MVLSDSEIIDRVTMHESNPRHMRIEPFAAECVKPPMSVSWGLSSFGYDFRLDRKFILFPGLFYLIHGGVPGYIANPPADLIIDPLTLGEEIERRKAKGEFQVMDADELVIPPGGFALGQSLERFDIPRDCLALVLGKSTYARCALNLNMTPLEPRWRGHITIELANLCGLPIRVRANHGIGQVVFFTGNPPINSYADKKGSSYQDQTEPTPPRVAKS